MRSYFGPAFSLLFSWVTCTGFAGERLRLPYPQQEPEHLVPVSPVEFGKDNLAEKLIGKKWGGGTMVYGYNSNPDFIVSAWGKDYQNYDYENPIHNYLTLIRRAENAQPLAKPKNIDVPIDAEFAVAIQRAWATMLLRTTYPRHQYLVADGWIAQFSVWITGLGGVYGEANSPLHGLPKELMDLGFALADYCELPAERRATQREVLIEKLRSFTAKVERSG
jgi:hypothetical protein